MFFASLILKRGSSGAGELTQWLRAQATIPEDPGLFPAPTWWLMITVCNSSSQRFGALCGYQVHAWCLDIYERQYSHTKDKNIEVFLKREGGS